MQWKFQSGESQFNNISKNFSKRKLPDALSQALYRHDLTPFSPSPYEEGIFISPRHRWPPWDIRDGPHQESDTKGQCWHSNAAVSSSEVCVFPSTPHLSVNILRTQLTTVRCHSWWHLNLWRPCLSFMLSTPLTSKPSQTQWRPWHQLHIHKWSPSWTFLRSTWSGQLALRY